MSIDKIISEIEQLENNYRNAAKNSSGHTTKEDFDQWCCVKADALVFALNIIDKHTEGFVLVPEGWVKVAKCPDGRCKDGVVPHQIGEFEWEPEQCQFCYEKQAMLQASKEGE